MSDKEIVLHFRVSIALIIIGGLMQGVWGAIAGLLIGRVIATILSDLLPK